MLRLQRSESAPVSTLCIRAYSRLRAILSASSPVAFKGGERKTRKNYLLGTVVGRAKKNSLLGARRITGRRRKGKRLAIPAFKMASSAYSAIADESLEDANFSRPFHYAFLEKRSFVRIASVLKSCYFLKKLLAWANIIV